MNGFNYFALLDKKQSGQDLTICLKIGGALVLLCALVYGLFAFQLLERRQQLRYLQELKADENLNKRYAAALSVSELADRTEKEVRFLELLDVYAGKENVGTKQLLDTVQSCILRGCRMTRFSLKAGAVTVEGTAPDLESVTAMEENFRACGAFSSVLFEVVEQGESGAGALKFTARMTLNGGADDHE